MTDRPNSSEACSRPLPTATELSGCAPDDATRLEVEDQPVIFRKAVIHWPLYRELSARGSDHERLDYLEALIGTAQINYVRIPSSLNGYSGFRSDLSRPAVEYYSDRSTFSEFSACLRRRLDDITADDFYAQSNAVTNFPILAAQIERPSWQFGRSAATTRIWIGCTRHVGALHYDHFENLVCMLNGHKRVLLFPFEVLADIYPTAPLCGIGGVTSSFANLVQLDYARFPRLEHAMARGIVATLEPGDLLWIPANWWHHVESTGLHIMVNLWLESLESVRLNSLIDCFIDSLRTCARLDKNARNLVREVMFASFARPLGAQSVVGLPPSLSNEVQKQRETLNDLDLSKKWKQYCRIMWDHYVFQVNGHPVSAFPEQFEQMLATIEGLEERVLEA